MDKKKAVYVPTVGEEIGNAVSHGVMSLLSLLALPFAAVWAYAHDPGGVLASVSVSVFVISIFLMLLASTLYHSMRPDSKHKAVFHKLDHIFIFVAIAGTYTPVALLVIGGWQGVFVTVLQWTAVLLGILYKTLARRSIPALSLTIYLVMGWTASPACLTPRGPRSGRPSAPPPRRSTPATPCSPKPMPRPRALWPRRRERSPRPTARSPAAWPRCRTSPTATPRF